MNRCYEPLEHAFAFNKHSFLIIYNIPYCSGPELPKDPEDALYLGVAFVNTVADRVGSILGDSMANASRLVAERDNLVDDFTTEVSSYHDIHFTHTLTSLGSVASLT